MEEGGNMYIVKVHKMAGDSRNCPTFLYNNTAAALKCLLKPATQFNSIMKWRCYNQ